MNDNLEIERIAENLNASIMFNAGCALGFVAQWFEATKRPVDAALLRDAAKLVERAGSAFAPGTQKAAGHRTKIVGLANECLERP